MMTDKQMNVAFALFAHGYRHDIADDPTFPRGCGQRCPPNNGSHTLTKPTSRQAPKLKRRTKHMGRAINNGSARLAAPD